MNFLRDLIRELFSMFLADAKLSGAIFALVGGIAVLIDFDGLDPLVAGFLLLVGCLAILAVITTVESRRWNRN